MRREEVAGEIADDRVEQSSGNVFADLGLPHPDEDLAKAEFIHGIGGLIAEKGLALADAATLLGIEATELSDILRGKFGGISIDRLFRFLNALGRDVEIIVRPGLQTGEGATRVVTI